MARETYACQNNFLLWYLRGPFNFSNNSFLWLVLFSGTYIPQKEVEVIEEIQATVIMTNEALKLRALMETKDRDGNTRVAGEEWLVKRVGAYLPGVHEEIVDVVQARVLTETVCMNRYLLCYTFLDFVFVIQRYV